MVFQCLRCHSIAKGSVHLCVSFWEILHVYLCAICIRESGRPNGLKFCVKGKNALNSLARLLKTFVCVPPFLFGLPSSHSKCITGDCARTYTRNVCSCFYFTCVRMKRIVSSSREWCTIQKHLYNERKYREGNENAHKIVKTQEERTRRKKPTATATVLNKRMQDTYSRMHVCVFQCECCQCACSCVHSVQKTGVRTKRIVYSSILSD